MPDDCTCAAARWSDALEAERLLRGRLGVAPAGARSFSSKKLLELALQRGDVAAAVADDLGDVGVVEQRVEQVLDADELVAPPARLVDGEGETASRALG